MSRFYYGRPTRLRLHVIGDSHLGISPFRETLASAIATNHACRGEPE